MSGAATTSLPVSWRFAQDHSAAALKALFPGGYHIVGAPPARSAPRRPIRAASPRRAAPPSPAQRSPAKAVDFSHLRVAASADMEENDEERHEAELERWSGVPNVPDPAYVAGQIVNAAEKTRKPIPALAPTGLAAEIVEAGKKRRGEI